MRWRHENVFSCRDSIAARSLTGVFLDRRPSWKATFGEALRKFARARTGTPARNFGQAVRFLARVATRCCRSRARLTLARRVSRPQTDPPRLLARADADYRYSRLISSVLPSARTHLELTDPSQVGWRRVQIRITTSSLATRNESPRLDDSRVSSSF